MLELTDVNAWYGESHILHAVNLKIGAGERAAILGRNGAGKTTILKSILAGGPRVNGRILWNGRNLGPMQSFHRIRQGIALVPEDRRIFDHITVAENIEMARYAAPPDRPAISASEVLKRFPILENLGNRPGGQLSGGQQQMLAVARAVAARPRLLLLDEPTEGLAPIIVEQLAEIVRTICVGDGVGMLLSEQNVWFARQCTTKVYVINAGSIVFGGSWDEFDARRELVERYLAV